MKQYGLPNIQNETVRISQVHKWNCVYLPSRQNENLCIYIMLNTVNRMKQCVFATYVEWNYAYVQSTWNETACTCQVHRIKLCVCANYTKWNCVYLPYTQNETACCQCANYMEWNRVNWPSMWNETTVCIQYVPWTWNETVCICQIHGINLCVYAKYTEWNSKC